MKMEELISVVVPVYNTAGYIERCLHSVLNQTYSQIEIIVVDDGSTDGGGKIIDALAVLEERIRVVHKANEGVAAARNIGIERAKGKYIMFLDSDDSYEPSLIETLYSTMKETGADLAICGIKKKSGTVVDDIPVTAGLVLHKSYDLGGFWLKDAVAFSSVNKMFKRECIGDKRFPRLRVCEDAVFVRDVVRDAGLVALVPECLYVNHQRMDSATKGALTDKPFEDTLKAVKMMAAIENKRWEGTAWDMSPRMLLFELLIAIVLAGNISKLKYIRDNSYYWKLVKSLQLPNKKADCKKAVLFILMDLRMYGLLLLIAGRHKEVSPDN